jgi:hypothetical protein
LHPHFHDTLTHGGLVTEGRRMSNRVDQICTSLY